MMNCTDPASNRLVPVRRKGGFTLVELLIVLFIFLLLSAVALPTIKNLLVNQKTSRSARNIIAFFDAAQSKAIAENRNVGVRIERLSNTETFGASASIRLRQLNGVAPYSGDAADAVAVLSPLAPGPVNTAAFSAQDSPLLWLSAQLLNNADPDDDLYSPIKLGDFFELPGGRTVPIATMTSSSTPTDRVFITFNLNEPTSGGALTFPGALPVADNDSVKFRIHRRPVPSSSATLDLLPGTAIDLNFSGVGITDNDFHPTIDTTDTDDDVDIIFSPDGSVEIITKGSQIVPVLGHVYLCLATLDGVIAADDIVGSGDANFFQNDDRVVSNVMSLESIWLKLDPQTGSMVASPFASVASPVATDDPDDAAFDTVLLQARSLAQVSATLDEAP